MITNKILNNLEYDKILQKLQSHLILEGSINKVLELKPAETFESAKELLNFTEEADKVLYQNLRNPLENFDKVDEILVLASKMATLTFSDSKKVAHLLRSSRIFKDAILSINDPSLVQFNYIANLLYENRSFENEIEETFISDEEISDRATPALYSIRNKIRKLNQEIKDRLNTLIRKKEVQKFLQDSIITSREGRYVIPVKSDCKGSVSGLVHDYSASGATIYVEPMEIVDINNDLRIAIVDERAEIERILEQFTLKVSAASRDLTMNELLLVDADIMLAKARYSKSIRAIKPNLTNDGSFDIKGGRHPLLDVKSVIPVSVIVPKDSCFLLISGPNTGGKTVTLKMTGLFSLMAMTGLYLPTKDDTTISFYKNIFSDIGDQQSIEHNLSTFSSHIVTLKSIIEQVTNESLVLLDEIGGGTDPQEGSALALAILEHLIDVGAKGIITTHYSELKEFSYTTDKILNASMEFDMETLAPTYRLNIGVPGNSKALEISSRLGMPDFIINRAKTRISPLKISFDQVLASAEKERLEAQQLKDKYLLMNRELELEIDKVKKEKDRLLNEKEKITRLAKIEAKMIVSSASTEAETLLESIKEIYNKVDEIGGKELIDASKIKNKISLLSENVEEEESVEIEKCDFDMKTAKIGQYVYVNSLSSICQITAINEKKKQVSVQFGNMRFDAKLGKIKGITEKSLKHYLKDNTPVIVKKKEIKPASVAINRKVDLEINVMGKRAYEAQNDVLEFLDRAYRANVEHVTIIHGIGTGALRKAISEELDSSNIVESHRPGIQGEGAHGVTVVEMKTK